MLFECLTDVDGDGYAPGDVGECFTIEMIDGYGDGWNGNILTLYIDGVVTQEFTNQNLISGSGVESETQEFCAPEGSSLSLLYSAGGYPGEISGGLTNQSGQVISFAGSPTAVLTFGYDSNGDGQADTTIDIADGDSFSYPFFVNGSMLYGGSDSDDTNASIQ